MLSVAKAIIRQRRLSDSRHSVQITWEKRFQDLIEKAEGLLKEKQPFFEENGQEILINIIPEKELRSLIASTLQAGSDIAYLEEYTEATEGKRAILVRPPFYNEELEQVVKNSKTLEKDQKCEAITEFYLKYFKLKKIHAVIELGYRFNPDLLISVNEKIIKKPGGERNKMADLLTQRLILIDPKYGAHKQFQYLLTGFKSAQHNAQAQIAAIKAQDDYDQSDLDQVYQNQFDIIDLRMMHFIRTPEHQTVWEICVALKSVESQLRVHAGDEHPPEKIRAFVDEKFSIKVSSFAEQRSMLEAFVRDFGTQFGDRKKDIMQKLSSILMNARIPSNEATQKELFLISKMRAHCLEYRASHANAPSNALDKLHGLAGNDHRAKIQFMDSAIRKLDRLVDNLRKDLVPDISDELEATPSHLDTRPIKSVVQFLQYCSEALPNASDLPKALRETHERASIQWDLIILLVHALGWEQIDKIDPLVTEVLQGSLVQIRQYGAESGLSEMTRFQCLTDFFDKNKSHREFIQTAMTRHLFNQFADLLDESLEHHQFLIDQQVNSGLISLNLILMNHILDFMLPFIQNGDPQALWKVRMQKQFTQAEAFHAPGSSLMSEFQATQYRFQGVGAQASMLILNDEYLGALIERLGAIKEKSPPRSAQSAGNKSMVTVV
jgi:hypothetical protein